jgi:FKBP-type peptidyl-prolyl cis-trans isomerase SlyD
MTDSPMPGNAAVVDTGSYVQIKYKVRIVDGPLLKGAAEPAIMDFVTGYRQVIPGLEKRLVGHSAGEKLAFTVPPEEAFGPSYPELIFEKNRDEFRFPAGVEPGPGMEIALVSSDPNAPDSVLIKEVLDDKIVIDCNHPFAGKALQYELEIIEARPASEDEICDEWEIKTYEGPCQSDLSSIVLGGEEPKEF